MPWEIRIVNDAGDLPLGTKQAVTDWVSTALPGVELQQPALPPPEILATFPAAVREVFTQPKLEALYEADAFFHRVLQRRRAGDSLPSRRRSRQRQSPVRTCSPLFAKAMGRRQCRGSVEGRFVEQCRQPVAGIL
jgi:hypothetical protein